MSREDATREWAVKFENEVLSKPEHAHLRPTTTTQDIVNLIDAINGHYEKKPISDCALAFMRPLKSLYTRYLSERGERTVLKCLEKAIKNRFAKGDDTGMPGLILADVLMAEKLAAEVMRRSGSVEQSSGEYQLAMPNEPLLVRWCKEMTQKQPTWPKRSDFATKEQWDEAMGLTEQEWWEAWVNAIEKNWGCYIHNAIPLHLREPVAEQQGKDHVRLLNYKREDGDDFDTGGRTVNDYRGPMDWTVSFTYHLLMLSQMTAKAHAVGIKWMDDVVRERLEAPRTSKQAWLNLNDVKKAVKKLSEDLDAGTQDRHADGYLVRGLRAQVGGK
ncbi:hypothetical protein IWZ03DRAFT_419178 [Phyllosticta citriasiana]|uniref:Uncharacterized protein n=1 Tax=Phyllosticta citriasiana TaxID=595635 RepID=A0ABR1K7S5_9PEZI